MTILLPLVQQERSSENCRPFCIINWDVGVNSIVVSVFVGNYIFMRGEHWNSAFRLCPCRSDSVEQHGCPFPTSRVISISLTKMCIEHTCFEMTHYFVPLSSRTELECASICASQPGCSAASFDATGQACQISTTADFPLSPSGLKVLVTGTILGKNVFQTLPCLRLTFFLYKN